MIANAEVVNPAYPFPWSNLFSPSATRAKPEQKVGGVTLPSLRNACATWIESTLSQPSSCEKRSALGDEDQALSTARTPQVIDVDADKNRETTVAKLEELFLRKVTLASVPNSEYIHLVLTKALNSVAKKDISEGGVLLGHWRRENKNVWFGPAY